MPEAGEEEAALEPDLPIVDAHHHIWRNRRASYTAEQIFADKTQSGHNIVATVFVEAGEGYREDGPEHLKPIGETELGAAIGAEADRRGGRYHGACAAISAGADLRLGDGVEEVLAAHKAAAPTRLRGIRHQAAADPDAPFHSTAPADMLEHADFRAGFARLHKYALVFEAWVLHPQLPHVTALARAFPETTIVLNHVGGPLAIGRYKGRKAEAFFEWRSLLKEVAACPNVVVKLGGLAMNTSAAMPEGRQQLLSSEAIASLQRDHLLTAIDVFGAGRGLFETNYPVDRWWTNYTRLWNAFKRVTADFTAADRAALFAGNAKRVYRIA